MLSEIEKIYATDLLNTLEPPALIELASTCTAGALTTSNTSDSINAILLHTVNIRSLFSRKKFTRKILFKYLHDKNISFPGNSEKAILVDFIIDFWNNQKPELSKSQSQVENSVNLDVKALAMKFSEWFYNRINLIVQQNRIQQNDINSLDRLKQEDFWYDAKISVELSQSVKEIVSSYHSEGSEECVALITTVCNEHSLVFSPNLGEEGTRGKIDPHGLVMIMSCGTLHSCINKQCVGLFEQLFGLIKDPMSNDNWKIKFSKLILRSQFVNKLPVLSSDF